MEKIYADFNARDEQGRCCILISKGKSLSEVAEELSISPGQEVILYQDEEDFEVVAVLGYGYTTYMAREDWFATPDWSTLVRKNGAGDTAGSAGKPAG